MHPRFIVNYHLSNGKLFVASYVITYLTPAITEFSADKTNLDDIIVRSLC